MKTYKVKKGDSTLNLKFTVEGYPTLDENWICTSELLDNITSSIEPIYSKIVERSLDNTCYEVNFSPAETEDGHLVEGTTYYWQITVSNPTLTPPYKKTTHRKLEIEYKG